MRCGDGRQKLDVVQEKLALAIAALDRGLARCRCRGDTRNTTHPPCAARLVLSFSRRSKNSPGERIVRARHALQVLDAPRAFPASTWSALPRRRRGRTAGSSRGSGRGPCSCGRCRGVCATETIAVYVSAGGKWVNSSLPSIPSHVNVWWCGLFMRFHEKLLREEPADPRQPADLRKLAVVAEHVRVPELAAGDARAPSGKTVARAETGGRGPRPRGCCSRARSRSRPPGRTARPAPSFDSLP